MSIQPNNLTRCQYLFNGEAAEIFPKEKNAAFVNESLETLMAVIDHLVTSNPEALFIFDPTTLNNQCHLYALFVTQAVNQAKEQRAAASTIPCVAGSPTTSAPESVGKTLQDHTELIDPRFLYHSFFLSHAFQADSNLLDQVVCKALTTMGSKAPIKKFRTFVKDPQGERLRASRQALNLLFAEHMERTLSSGKGALYSELAAVARANPQLPPSRGGGALYTYPKFTGVVYMMDSLSREKTPLLFKVKVVTKEGTGFFMHSSQNVQALDPADPVMVVEMVAAGENLSCAECCNTAKKCPTYSYRNVKSNDRHDPKAPCLFCTPNKIDVASHQQRLKPALAQTEKMLLALGADFVLQNQSEFLLPFFSNQIQFPLLTARFEASVPNIQNLSLSMTTPLNMSVSHVYPDCAFRASEDTLVINAPYDEHLRARGLII